MTPDQLRQHLNRLDLEPPEVAQFLGVSLRSLQRWLDDEEIPGPVEQALRAWLLLNDHNLAWRPDSVSIAVDDQEQIGLLRAHAIELS